MSTPHDVPTHMLDNPEQYITRVGKVLRKLSLDELPQIWDIFIGNIKQEIASGFEKSYRIVINLREDVHAKGADFFHGSYNLFVFFL